MRGAAQRAVLCALLSSLAVLAIVVTRHGEPLELAENVGPRGLGVWTTQVPSKRPGSLGFDENAFLNNQIGQLVNGKMVYNKKVDHEVHGVGRMVVDDGKNPWEPSLQTRHSRCGSTHARVASPPRCLCSRVPPVASAGGGASAASRSLRCDYSAGLGCVPCAVGSGRRALACTGIAVCVGGGARALFATP